MAERPLGTVIEGRMPIYRLMQHASYNPEQREAMGAAFESVLREFGLTDRDDPFCEIIAHKIIELNQQGVRTASEMHDLAVSGLRG